MSTVLAPRDAERLADLEVTIALGLTTFVEVGAALAEIREAKLYRASFQTFDEYCHAKWRMSRAYAYRLIESSQVVGNLSPIGNTDETPIPAPTNESQTRPLAGLEPEQQREVWKEAVETAPAGGVTAKHVAATVERVTKPLFIDPPAKPTPIIPIRRDPVTDTISAARAEYRSSEDGRLSAYISALPPVPSGIGDGALRDLHAVSLEILGIHAAFINRAIAQRERVNVTA